MLKRIAYYRLLLFYIFLIFNYYYSAVWPEESKRKQFFENYAKENEFDPLICENWYFQSPQKIKHKKVHFNFIQLNNYNAKIDFKVINLLLKKGIIYGTVILWR